MCGCGNAAVIALLALCGCERYPSGGDISLHSDMIDQPSFRPQREPLPLPEGAIPVNGWEAPVTREQANALVNPVAAIQGSVERGKVLFMISCRPCHGADARGDGPVAAKIAKPANLHDPKYAKEKDGFFYYVLRYGGVIMPPQTESLSSAERWQIVTYIRTLQR